MGEFRVQTDASGIRHERLLIACALLSPIVGVALFLFIMFNFAGSKGDLAARWLGLSVMIGGIVAAYSLAIRISMKRAKRHLAFFLNDNGIIRKREGWPDDRIAFSEIDALYDGPGGLVVESAEPLKRISVPKEVNGFEAIRAELAKHHSFSAQAKPSRTKLSGTGLVLWIVSILSWAAVIFIFYKVMQPR